MTDGTLGDTPGAARAAGTAVDDPSRDPAGPTGNGLPGKGAARGASAHGSAAASALTNDSAVTASLPAVGGPDDPYVDRNARAARGSGSAPTIGPSRAFSPPPPPPSRPNLPSAVDQYAALGLAAGAGSTPAISADAMAAAPTVAGAGSMAPAPPLTSLPGPAAPAPAPGSAAPGAGPLTGVTTPLATAVRRPRNERTPRRARLQLRHFNVWTVFKFSVVLAVALFFVWMIIVAVLYGMLDHLKVIDKINKTVQTIENNSDTNNAVTPRIVFTAAFLIGLVDIVLFIVLTTIGSVVYNLCADLVGGIEVTLAERD